jgi:4-amino-4-deoxy-L-arabinose transferase-like glycosyltransferase
MALDWVFMLKTVRNQASPPVPFWSLLSLAYPSPCMAFFLLVIKRRHSRKSTGREVCLFGWAALFIENVSNFLFGEIPS